MRVRTCATGSSPYEPVTGRRPSAGSMTRTSRSYHRPNRSAASSRGTFVKTRRPLVQATSSVTRALRKTRIVPARDSVATWPARSGPPAARRGVLPHGRRLGDRLRIATEPPGRASAHDGGDDRGRNCDVPPPRSLGSAIPHLEPAPGCINVVWCAEAPSIRVPSRLQRRDSGPARWIGPDPPLDRGTVLRAGRPVEVPGERAEIDGGRGRRHLPYDAAAEGLLTRERGQSPLAYGEEDRS